MPDGPFRLLCVGVGGQGVLTVARVFGEGALKAGLEVAVGQIHGMSQRGGSVESTVTVAAAGQATHTFIGPGEADVVLALEPLEGLRARPRMSARTRAIVNRETIVPFSATLQGRTMPGVDAMLADLRACCGAVVALDGAAVTRATGERRHLNLAMLGALAALGGLPFPESILWDAIAAHPFANRRAFDLGKELTAS